MKNLFLFLLLIIFSENIIFAQSNVADNKSCPSFSIKESDESGSKGIISFTVEFENGFDASNLSYNWSFSEGKIIGSRDTKVIAIERIHSCILDVTVEITRLPKECSNTKSYRINFCNDPIPILVGEYEKLSNGEENFWLDKLVAELKNNPGSTPYIFKAFPPKFSKISIYQNLHSILNYLKTKGIDKRGIDFNILFNDKYQTRLYIVPLGSDIPTEGGDELFGANELAKKIKTTKINSQKKPRITRQMKTADAFDGDDLVFRQNFLRRSNRVFTVNFIFIFADKPDARTAFGAGIRLRVKSSV